MSKRSNRKEPEQRELPDETEEIIIGKSKGFCLFISILVFGLATYAMSAVFQLGWAQAPTLILLPFSLLFYWLGFFTLKRSGNRIILNKIGILNEDYAPEPIPWDNINSFSIRNYGRPNIHTLNIFVNGNKKYYKRTIFGKSETQIISFSIGDHCVDYNKFLILLNDMRQRHRHSR